MGLFSKNKKEVVPAITTLPELPKLPELPSDSNTQFNKPKLNALPRFPSNPLADKFSQNTIKDAVSGEKEDEENADESEEEVQMMPKLPTEPPAKVQKPFPRPMMAPPQEEYPVSMPRMQQKSEPVFVRLDKFEENIELFEKIKKQFLGVEKILDDIKQTKDQEDKELESWQQKLQTMKDQMSKIDRDIFSKI